MFDKSVLTAWSGPGNEATVTVTFVNPIVFHKLVIVKKNGVDKAGLIFFTMTLSCNTRIYFFTQFRLRIAHASWAHHGLMLFEP